MLFGIAALHPNQKPKSSRKTVGELWHTEKVTPGAIAFVSVLVS